MAADHTICVGGPAPCLETVRWYEAQGVDQLIFLVQAGWLAHEHICSSLRRFGSEVILPLRAS
jgi:imidazole glycerol phosphate synthase subunit HisF